MRISEKHQVRLLNMTRNIITLIKDEHFTDDKGFPMPLTIDYIIRIHMDRHVP